MTKDDSSPIATSSTFIELHVPDFNLVKKFYRRLGFDECKNSGDNDYLKMQLEKNVLCFWCGSEAVYQHTYFSRFPRNTTKGYGVEIVLQLADIERLYNKVLELNRQKSEVIEILSPLKARFWGAKDFRIVDPFGFYLRFTSYYQII
jgi:hypothetical protein